MRARRRGGARTGSRQVARVGAVPVGGHVRSIVVAAASSPRWPNPQRFNGSSCDQDATNIRYRREVAHPALFPHAVQLAFNLFDELLVQREECAEEAGDEQQVFLAVWELVSGLLRLVEPRLDVRDFLAKCQQARASNLLADQVAYEQA